MATRGPLWAQCEPTNLGFQTGKSYHTDTFVKVDKMDKAHAYVFPTNETHQKNLSEIQRYICDTMQKLSHQFSSKMFFNPEIAFVHDYKGIAG